MTNPQAARKGGLFHFHDSGSAEIPPS